MYTKGKSGGNEERGRKNERGKGERGEGKETLVVGKSPMVFFSHFPPYRFFPRENRYI